MTNTVRNVLLIGSDYNDAYYVTRLLTPEPNENFNITHIETLDKNLEKETLNNIDIIILDFQEASKSVVNLFHTTQKAFPHCPVVVLTQEHDDTLSATLIQEGVQDYLSKDKVNQSNLRRVVNYSIERQRLNSEILNKSAQLEALTEELAEKNIELEHLSIIDALTELYNRRFIEDTMRSEFDKFHRYKTNLACLMIDFDHFKNINDTYGHQCGDYVLIESAKMIRTLSRTSDVCGRYGGEEFIVVTSLKKDDAIQFANRLNTMFREKVFTFQENKISVTISIGIVSANESMDNADALIKAADEALYTAKESGRDCVVVWNSDTIKITENGDKE